MNTVMRAILMRLGTLFVFAGILASCLAVLLLVIAMARFPPLLIAVLLACWIFNERRSV